VKTYLDTSALVKLVVQEHESTALRKYLRAHRNDTLFTAALARTELVRAVAGAGPAATALARRLLTDLDTVNLTRGLLDSAADLPPIRLRTLDAIHLAAALRAADGLRAVITYDSRMAAAAAAAGIPVHAPGSAEEDM